MQTPPSISNFSDKFQHMRLQEVQLVEDFFEEYYFSKLSEGKKDTHVLIKTIANKVGFEMKAHHCFILNALLDSFSDVELAVITQDQTHIEKLIAILTDVKEDDMFEETFEKIANAFFLDLPKRQEAVKEFETWSSGLTQDLPRGKVDANLSKTNNRIFRLISSNERIPLIEIERMGQATFSCISPMVAKYNSTFTPMLPDNLKSVFVDKAHESKTNFKNTFKR